MRKSIVFLVIFLIIYIKNDEVDNQQLNQKGNVDSNEENIENEDKDNIDIFPDTQYVVEITDNNFNEIIKNNANVLILFYHQNYEQCYDFIPKYIKLAELYKQKNQDLIFGRMNAEINLESVKINSKNEYPSLKLYINENPNDFPYLFDENYVIKFLTKKLINPILERNNFNIIKEETNNFTQYFISTINSENEKEKYENLKQIAGNYDDVFDIFNCVECKSQLQSDLVLYKLDPEEKIEKYDNSSFSIESIDYFIKKHYRIVNEELNSLDFSLIFGENITMISYFRENENEQDTQKDLIFSNLHLKYEGKYIITHSDIKDSDTAEECKEFFNLDIHDLPIVKMYDPKTSETFTYQGEITNEKIIEFIIKYENKELKRDKISENVPLEQPSSIFYLVSKTFKEEIYNGALNYVVLFLSYEKDTDELATDIYSNLTSLSDKYRKLNDYRIKFGIINLFYNEIDEKIEETPLLGLYINGKKDNPIFFNNFDIDEIEYWISNNLGWKEIPQDIDSDSNNNNDDNNSDINDDDLSRADL